MELKIKRGNRESGKRWKLYNVIFPIWFLILIPPAWLIVIPVNFVIDSLVLLLTLKYLNWKEMWQCYRKVIFKVFCFGFLSDFLGALLMVAVDFLPIAYDTPLRQWMRDFSQAVFINPLSRVDSSLYVALCVAFSAFLIYTFNRRVSFRSLEMEDSLKKKLSLSLAVFTAPYVVFVPTMWFYSLFGPV